MEQENRKYIAIISFLRKFIRIFFNIFFNIYILKIVNNDLSFVIKYNLFGVFVELIICYTILKVINSQNAKIIYKASFPLMILNVLALLVFKESIVKYIFIFKILERLSEVCYSMPYELIVIGSNNNKTMSSFKYTFKYSNNSNTNLFRIYNSTIFLLCVIYYINSRSINYYSYIF